MANKLIYIFVFIIFCACSGITVINEKFEYSEDFLKVFTEAKKSYRLGKKSFAQRKLNLLLKNSKLSDEKAKILNQLGIYSFEDEKLLKAKNFFEDASSYVLKDLILKSEVGLNLSSTYYKLGMLQEAYQVINQTNAANLDKKSQNSFNYLKLTLAREFNDKVAILNALGMLLKESRSFEEIRGADYKVLLEDTFKLLSREQKLRYLYENEDRENIVYAYLGVMEAKISFYKGDKEEADKVVLWLEDHFIEFKDVESFVEDFKFRKENLSQIDNLSLGVILPLSGSKSRFGRKALMGIDAALNFKDSEEKAIKVYTRDSKNNPLVAKDMVKELIQKHHVSIIIGGLFPGTATQEYLEAKKYGAFYISLTPIELESERKNHLLVEVPGSIQSQLSKIFSTKLLDKIGSKVAFFYPNDKRGKVYLKEVWKRKEQELVDITSAYEFDSDFEVKDYRPWVEKLLGLKYKRERLEEFDMWRQVFELEKSTSIRRIQTLRPVIDFDWVFVPSYPHQAQQFLPTFQYYDAKNLIFIGDPSWVMSAKLLKNQDSSWGKLIIIGDNSEDFSKKFYELYRKRNKKNPSYIETWSFESTRLAINILNGRKFEKRSDLENYILELKSLRGITGAWSLQNNMWIKDLDFLEVKNGKVRKLEFHTLDNVKKQTDDQASSTSL